MRREMKFLARNIRETDVVCILLPLQLTIFSQKQIFQVYFETRPPLLLNCFLIFVKFEPHVSCIPFSYNFENVHSRLAIP